MSERKVNGWDERDYKLWSELQSLPNYGLIVPRNPMVALSDVIKAMEEAAEKRFHDKRK